MGWSYGGTAATVLLQIIASVLFARLLGTRITGVFAFGLLAFAPFRFLCEFGIGSALVQKPDLCDADLQIAMSRSLILALFVCCAWLLCMPALAAGMHQQADIPALNCFAIVFLCLPLQTTCTAVLTRHLDQRFLQVSTLLAYAGGYLAVGALGALRGWGVWSLVLGFVVQNLIATVLLYAHTRIAVRLRFAGDASFLWRFGSRATAINISNWLTSSLDNMAVAWFFGTRSLGVYSVAYGLVRAPADKIVATLQNVLFPASLLARHDQERLTKGCIATLDAVFLFTAPAFCVVAILSGTIIDTLYGPEWHAAAAVLPPLALSMVFHCITVIVSALLWGTGGVSRDVRLQWISAALLLAAVIVAARYSLVAVAWMVLPVTALRALWGLAALARTIGIAARRIVRGFLGGAVLAALLVPAMLFIDMWMRAEFSSAPLRLTGEVGLAAVLWMALLAASHARLATPELRAGLHSARTSLRLGKSHA